MWHTAHSITSSARSSSVIGTVRPRALAVLRLMISSTFVACWTGRSVGALENPAGVDANLSEQGIGAELLDPFAQHILMNVQVPGGLRHRHPAFPDQLDCLNLELSSEPLSPHDPHLRLHETPKLSVHQ